MDILRQNGAFFGGIRVPSTSKLVVWSWLVDPELWELIFIISLIKLGGIHPDELLEFTQVNSIHHSWVNLAHSPIDELMNHSLIHPKMGEWVNGCGVDYMYWYIHSEWSKQSRVQKVRIIVLLNR